MAVEWKRVQWSYAKQRSSHYVSALHPDIHNNDNNALGSALNEQ